MIAYFEKYEAESESSDKDMTNEELTAKYRILLTKVDNHKQNINGLLQEKVKQTPTISNMEEEVALLNSELENMTKSICMLNNGSDMLDEILEVGKMSRNLKGIWFDPRSMIKKDINHPKNIVPPENKTEFQVLNHMSQPHAQHVYTYNGKNEKIEQKISFLWKIWAHKALLL